MIRTPALPVSLEARTVPAGCIVDESGAWIYDTRLVHVEAAADYYGRPVVTADGYHACVRVLPGGQVLVLRAPVEAVAHV